MPRLNIFLSHSSRLGFALHIPRFLQRIPLSSSTSSHYPSPRPHEALLSTISLWAICLSRGNWTGADISEVEQFVLARALQNVPAALASASVGDGATERVDFVQAEVLLALYFFCEGRLLEGRYHASAATSAALSWGMHQIGSEGGRGSAEVRGMSMAGLSLVMSNLEMARPRDAIELGERINVFWSAYVLDRCWSVALDSPSVLVEEGSEAGTGKGIRITTPLPMLLESYDGVSRARSCFEICSVFKLLIRLTS